VPAGASFDGVDRADHQLRSLPVSEEHGLVWVIPTPNATLNVDEHLGGLQEDFASYGLGSYHHYKTQVIRRRFNWKMMTDTFLETYHFDTLHKTTVGPIFFGNLAPFDAFGPNGRMVAVRRSIVSMRNEPETDWDLIPHTGIVYTIFPNTVLVSQGDHIETWRAYPTGNGTDECIMYASLYTPEAVTTASAAKHWDANMDLLINTVEREDFPLSEGIQRGCSSGAQRHLTYGRNEPALIHHHKALRRALGLEEIPRPERTEPSSWRVAVNGERTTEAPARVDQQ
jgi:phenylpropionate dioxygenase-like ring-hydroxylating dioxygenase large terminal subunit